MPVALGTPKWLHLSFSEVALTNPYPTRKITVYVRINYTSSSKYLPVVIGATIKIKKLGLLLLPLCSYPRQGEGLVSNFLSVLLILKGVSLLRTHCLRGELVQENASAT